MRTLITILVVAAAACSGRSASGPAWPKSAGSSVDADKPEDDGGESLKPRREAVASVEASTEPAPAPATETVATEAGPTPTETKPDPDAKPDPATPTPATTVEPPVIEEITIEITGD